MKIPWNPWSFFFPWLFHDFQNFQERGNPVSNSNDIGTELVWLRVKFAQTKSRGNCKICWKPLLLYKTWLYVNEIKVGNLYCLPDRSFDQGSYCVAVLHTWNCMMHLNRWVECIWTVSLFNIFFQHLQLCKYPNNLEIWVIRSWMNDYKLWINTLYSALVQALLIISLPMHTK